jgi:hypothetical protein
MTEHGGRGQISFGNRENPAFRQVLGGLLTGRRKNISYRSLTRAAQ